MQSLDEPTTGLHCEDVRKLPELLHAPAEQDNGMVVIEHDPGPAALRHPPAPC